ncbi:EAL domain-containing protein [Ectothiorhodospiraceae bacterium WFHF3C12]|nr:EAL domain-containing protein [Ectothiorhodospiraceae bacterium WFHF3C12]
MQLGQSERRLFEEFFSGPRVRWLTVGCVVVLLGAVWMLVYLTGGTAHSYLHLIYIPIVLAGVSFGLEGGIIAALFAGLVVLGPLMPLHVATGEPQPATSWVFRVVLMTLVGGFTGLLVGRLRKRLRRMRWNLYHHPVTQLPTRLSLEKRLSRGLHHDAGQRKQALVMIAVNNIETVSNILGSQKADSLPAAVALAITGRTGRSGSVYQLHTNKLAVLISENRQPIHVTVRRIMGLLSEPVDVEGVPVFVDTAFGSVSVALGESSPEELIRKANIALEKARAQGRRHVQYSRTSDDTDSDKLHLLSEFPRAVRENELRLYFQPKVDLQSGQIAGAEALVRWQHPRRGFLSPGAFVPWVEETALMQSLTNWVVDEALRHAGQWHEAGHPIGVAINISARDLSEEGLVEHLQQRVAESNLDPAAVELEITESAVTKDPKAALRTLAKLKSLGVMISLDDFGDGYTSLSQLSSLPLDRLKIDQSIIRGAHEESRKRKIVAAILSLAHELDLPCVAEGIEDQATEDMLKALGCRYGQGFYYSKPITPAQLLSQRTDWAIHREAETRAHTR